MTAGSPGVDSRAAAPEWRRISPRALVRALARRRGLATHSCAVTAPRGPVFRRKRFVHVLRGVTTRQTITHAESEKAERPPAAPGRGINTKRLESIVALPHHSAHSSLRLRPCRRRHPRAASDVRSIPAALPARRPTAWTRILAADDCMSSMRAAPCACCRHPWLTARAACRVAAQLKSAAGTYGKIPPCPLLCAYLDDDGQRAFIDAMAEVSVPKNEVIMRQGASPPGRSALLRTAEPRRTASAEPEAATVARRAARDGACARSLHGPRRRGRR